MHVHEYECQHRLSPAGVSAVQGTLNHMAPELLLHGHASRASDVYAFGILMVRLLNGCSSVCFLIYHNVQLLSVCATVFAG